jgi:hypothetical protein
LPDSLSFMPTLADMLALSFNLFVLIVLFRLFALLMCGKIF